MVQNFQLPRGRAFSGSCPNLEVQCALDPNERDRHHSYLSFWSGVGFCSDWGGFGVVLPKIWVSLKK